MKTRYNPLSERARGFTALKAPRRPKSEAALERATNATSTANYQKILEGFTARGIPPEEIKPRENVLTFRAWRALGRIVRKGEHGIQNGGSNQAEPKATMDPSSGHAIMKPAKKRGWITTVFHITQTDPIATATSANVVVPVDFKAEAPAVPVPAAPRPSWRERYAARMTQIERPDVPTV